MSLSNKIELETGGRVWKLFAAVGDQVSEGQELFIMEVMKMEVPYEAPCDGVVKKVNIEEGQVLDEGDVAIEIEAS